MAFEHYDPAKPTLIPVGPQKITRSSWDGQDRRHQNRAPRNPDWKFREVQIPTYQSNDREIRLDGFYPSNN